jgi:RimJ/RimL family protein N-acetyltransferase
MKISESLFVAENICLAPIDHEKDAEIESRWTHDAEYLRLLSLEPALPQSATQLKKRYEKIEKDQNEKKDLFYFTVRMRSDDRLVGYARLYWIEWSNAGGFIQLGIGDPSDRRHGYGTEVLRLLLRYAFDELNLYRLTAVIPEYNPVALRLFSQAGFVEEVRRRKALERDGRRWDVIHLGILHDEWDARQAAPGETGMTGRGEA